MRADYDSKANAISIALAPAAHADKADQVHPRAVVALSSDQPVELQILYPDLGIDEPLDAVAEHFRLDRGALKAAAQAALAAPDRVITLDVSVHSAA